jgi:cellulose synthase/poly-beta-1,6-N-acetylglucosamine synthase-like glycosyltransferase
MVAYRMAWSRVPENPLPPNDTPTTTIAVIIAARDEAQHIQSCLDAIHQGTYPAHLREVWVIDDFSEDDTVALASAHPLPNKRVLSLADYLPPEHRYCPNKKAAISLAVSRSNASIMVTTDADCIAPPDWLRRLVAPFDRDKNVMAVAGPVGFHREYNLLQRFQSLDFVGMMGITAAGLFHRWHTMGNGANLAYRKMAFDGVNGYVGDGKASGDDMFLLQKITSRWPGSVVFVKDREAVVRTEAKPDWGSFWQQRLRWGTKNAALPEWRMRLSLLVVWVHCLLLLLAPLLALADGLAAWAVWLVWGLKLLSDWLLLRPTCYFFQRTDLLKWFLPACVLHVWYIAAVGTMSVFRRKYTWKGRVVPRGG